MADILRSIRRLERENVKYISDYVERIGASIDSLSDWSIQDLRKIASALQAFKKHVTEVRTRLDGLSEDNEELEDAYADVAMKGYDVDAGISAINDELSRRKEASVDQTPSSAQLRTAADSGIRLASEQTYSSGRATFCKIEVSLPEFDGDILKYRPFWAQFKERVHDNPAFSVVDKFSILLSKLKGDVRDRIALLPPSELSYNKAVDQLKQRYGRECDVIRTLIDALYDMETPIFNYKSMLKYEATFDSVADQLLTIDNGSFDSSPGHHFLVNIARRKLNKQAFNNMELRHNGDWTLTVFREQLRFEIKRLERAAPDERTNSSQNSQRNWHSKEKTKGGVAPATALNVASTSYTIKCFLCNGPHSIFACNRYKTRTEIDERVKELRLCFRCMRKGHRSQDCQERKACKFCKDERHHGLLCRKRDENGASTTAAKTSAVARCTRQNRKDGFRSGDSGGHKSVALPTAKFHINTGKDTVTARGMFDLGSQESFVTRSLMKRAKLRVTGTVNMTIDGFNTTGTNRSYDVTQVKIKTPEEVIELSALVVETLPTRVHTPGIRQLTQRLKRMGEIVADDFEEGDTVSVDLIVGADNFDRLVSWPTVNGVPVFHSKLGIMPVGCLPNTARRATATTGVVTVLKIATRIDEDVDKLWKLDNIGINPEEAHPDDNLALQTFRESIRYEDGRYTARLPWKPFPAMLPIGSGLARGRLENNLKRMRTEPEKLQAYHRVIEEQLENDFIEEVNPAEPAGEAGVHYLPHHSVMKASPTTPIRVVFDCSARVRKSAACLNDCLFAGPNMVQELTKVLMRWRMNSFAITADIKKAFLMINLDRKDRDVTRFFWPINPIDPHSEVKVYRFKVVLFGATCSQFILNATIRHHLEQCSENDKNTAKQIQRNIYVDNIFAAGESEEKLTDFYQNASRIMNEAGLQLREWATNAPTTRNVISSDDCLDERVEVPVLGLRWQTADDTIRLAPSDADSQVLTKRGMLSYLASQYDPLGLMIPVTIRGRLLIKETWSRKLDWDEELPEDIANDWQTVTRDTKQLSNVALPRATLHHGEATLHAFADASTTAYGAVVYGVQNGKTSLLIAKGRVAPVRTLSVPKLELTAMVLAARLISYAVNAYSEEIEFSEIHLWTDSEICLRQLMSNKSLETYVRNRVDEIHLKVPTARCHHIVSAENPADIITRGWPLSKLMDSSRWWHGPNILVEGTFPPDLALSEPAEVTAVVSVATERKKSVLRSLFETKSSFNEIVKTIAWVQRYIYKLKQRSRRLPNSTLHLPITAEERINAENCVFREVQREAFPEILASARDRKPNHKMAKQLRLMLRDDLLVCDSRLDEAVIPDSAKYPILLPSKHEITERLIQEAHQKQLHVGTNETLAHLRERFWIIKGRQRVKQIVQRCVRCRRVGGPAYVIPEAPALPRVRVREAPPFSATGVDYGGPFTVRIRNSRTEKRYIALFTCASTRAVHLEVADGLSMEDFLHVFHRFVSRRTYPRVMISDNGTNFVSTSKLLKEWQETPSIQEELSQRHCQWKFIPSRAPWFGGFYERMIGITKTMLRRNLGKACVTDPELRTLVCKMEMQINDRPLTYISAEPGEMTPLTPSILLQGFRNGSLPVPIVDPDIVEDPPALERSDLTKRLAHNQLVFQRCWMRWQKEYLLMLRQERSGRGASTKPQLNDVVLIHDEGPRLTWQMGRIIELLPGPDDQVRVVRLQTSKGTLIRPISKVYPLEVAESLPIDSDDDHRDEESASSVEAIESAETPDEPNALLSLLVPQRKAARDAASKMSQMGAALPWGNV